MIAVEGPPTPSDMVATVWHLIYMRKQARAHALARTLRSWFVASDEAQRGQDSIAAHERTFLHGVELTLETMAEAKRMKAVRS